MPAARGVWYAGTDVITVWRCPAQRAQKLWHDVAGTADVIHGSTCSQGSYCVHRMGMERAAGPFALAGKNCITTGHC
jgi:hypothetical protein